MYIMVGNGSTGGVDISSTFVRLSGSNWDYFVLADYNALDQDDWDLNAGAPMLVPNTELVPLLSKTANSLN
jgi:hypothetical protein